MTSPLSSFSTASVRWGRPLAVLVVCFFSFFLHLGAPEVSLMEARNFVAAREMAGEGSSWLIPTMNGELRLAKPPLPTWAVAALMRLTGNHTTLAVLRLPAALMATLLVFFFWGLARELTRVPYLPATVPERDLQELPRAQGRTAWLAALVLASSLLTITTGREGQWDMFSNSFLVAGLWLLTRGWNSARPAYGWYVAAGLAIGCSMLSKGPVALYAVLLPYVGVSHAPLNPHRAAVRQHWRGSVLALALGLGVGLSWPLYLYTHVPAAALAVAQTEASSWRDRHVQAPWYYVNFPVFMGIWALIALAVLVVPYARRRAGRYVPYLLALGWLVASFVLLSIVPEKKERYMIPLLPPMALLVAGLLRYLETAFQPTAAAPMPADRRLLRGWAGLLLLVCVAGPVAMAVVRLPGFGPATLRFAAVLALLSVIAFAVVRYGWQRLQPVALMAASLTGMAVLLALLLPAYPVWESRRDAPGLRHITDVQQQPALRQLPWYSLGDLHVKQVWAAGRAIPVWRPDTTARRPAGLPLVLVTPAPYTPAQLPAGWRNAVLVAPADSFYLGRKRDSGVWYYTVLAYPPAR